LDVEDSGELFQIEITDLRPRSAAHAYLHSAMSPLAAGNFSPRMRGVRLIASMLVVVLALLDLLPSIQHVASVAAPSGATPPVAADEAVAGADLTKIWPALEQRDLHLPGVVPGQDCPATPGARFTAGYDPGLGQGPAYVVGPGSADGSLIIASSSTLGAAPGTWSGQKVMWVIQPLYQGPVLVRGRRIDGPGQVRFNGGLDEDLDVDSLPSAPLLPELRLVGDSSYGAPWLAWVAYTRMRGLGCYAYQVDGLSFSETIVFRVVSAR
jgi:hypothetical protein